MKELITIHNQQTASIVAGMLKNNGIETMLLKSPVNAAIPSPNIFGGYTLYVPDALYDQANRLLVEFGDDDL